MNKLRKLGMAAAVAMALWGGSSQAAENLLYDWRATSPGTTPVPGFVPAPFVNDSNATSPAILAQLAAQQAATPGLVAIKVPTNQTLSPASINALFNNPNFTINYTFYDVEPNNAGTLATIASQSAAIHSAPKGTSTKVGNFALAPLSGDNSGFASGTSSAQYAAAGVNMANADLYPGLNSYKDPAAVGGTSTSPNIRSSLFTLPVKRETYVTANLPAGHLNIPYVNRFNNADNPQLDSDNNPANGFAFVQNNAVPSKGQLLSTGDFKALVAHYRLRGADGLHLLDGGVQGYNQASFEADAKAGWQIPAISSIFAAPDASLATLDTVVTTVAHGKQDFETAGIVFSGVYSLSQNKLALLVSNMSENPETVKIPAKIGGKSVVGDIPIAEGEHRLLEYTGAGTQWVLAANTPLFTSAAETNRNGVGVPEPVAAGSLTLLAVGSLLRRRRRQA